LELKNLRASSGLVTVALLSLGASPSRSSAADDVVFRPMSFHSLSMEKARTFSADFYGDNHDRDPNGIDVFDAGFRFRFQAGERTELFAMAIADRVVALPETPAIPSAPRDLIFTGAIRMMPNSFNGEHPYLDKRGNASFDAFIPGTVTAGVARTLYNDGAAYGASAAIVVPLAGSLNALRSGANSGRPDFSIAGLSAHDVLGGKAHARLGFTLTGKGSWPDRSFSVAGNTVQAIETSVPIGNRLEAGLAWLRPLSETLAVGVEARTSKEFVGEERIDAVSPIDAVLGVHKTWGRWTLSAGLLSHFRALESAESRANPFAGAIDLSNVSVLNRNAFLAQIGLGAVAGQVRDGAHIVVIGSSATALPQGAIRVAPTYSIRSEHNLGYVFSLTFRR
jgi:hypothetical protein